MSRAERVEGGLQVVLMLGVGLVAAAASWSHVVSLAVAHGQPGWLAVADAAVIETLAVSSGLEVRRRRRAERRTGFVLAVLVVSVVLSLAAQVAEAERSVWGWLLAAVPAVGFLVLVKIALGTTAVTRPSPSGVDAPEPVLASERLDEAEPWRDPWQRAEPLHVEPAALADESQEQSTRTEVDGLLLVAQAVATELERAGETLTRDALAARIRGRGHSVSNTKASELLRQLRGRAA